MDQGIIASAGQPASGARAVVIVGGVARGASCAAPLGRQDAGIHIVMPGRSPYASLANCGLPCHIDGGIDDGVALGLARPANRQGRVVTDRAVVPDVPEDEVTHRPIPGEVDNPLNQLRARLEGFSTDRPIQIGCALGANAYTASRLLDQHGHKASLPSGGSETWFCVDACN